MGSRPLVCATYLEATQYKFDAGETQAVPPVFWYDTAVMTLKEVVEKYLAVAGAYGKPVSLSALGMSPEEIELTFGQLDEDYHISRFIHFQSAAGANFAINGFPQTHVSIDAEIQSAL